MKRYSIFLFILLLIPGLWSCFDDKGNYDYHEINELTVKEYGDSTYYVLYLADTLRVEPKLEGTLDPDASDGRYEFRWIVKDNNDLSKENWGTEIARTRKLEYPIDLKPGTYTLYLKIRDKETGLLFSTYSSIVVSTTLTRGLLVLGDDEVGNVQLDMISMLPDQDTLVLHNLLKDSGLPPMQGAVSVYHSGTTFSVDFVRLWIMGENASYFVRGADITGTASNTMKQMFYSSLKVPEDVHPIDVFPRVNSISGRQVGSNRGMLLSDGSIVVTNILGGEFYGNPTNRLSNDPEHLLRMAPYVFYSLGNYAFQSYMAYDMENEQFLFATYSAATMSLKSDLPIDPFPWNQSEVKRTLLYGENTRNTYGGSNNGASFALMKDIEGNYFIYGFNTTGTMWVPPTKLGSWEIKKEVAINFDQASLYLFSSARTLMYYVVGGAVYCYDYNAGNERCEKVLDFGSDEITYLKTDLQTESRPFNFIWIGTYNDETGGTLAKYEETTNQNLLQLKLVEDSRWTNLCKIKSVDWRYSQD